VRPEILLSSGEMFNYLDPDPDVVTIEVIAAALSKQCRFAGHLKRFYSVAEHCVRGSYACSRPLDFLLHDASEAFVTDVPTPLKRLLSNYVEIEDRVHALIAKKFGVDPHCPEVKHTDLVMLVTEGRDLKDHQYEGAEPITYLHSLAAQSGRPETWERNYINRYKELTA
jgi:hypothetical protein